MSACHLEHGEFWNRHAPVVNKQIQIAALSYSRNQYLMRSVERLQETIDGLLSREDLIFMRRWHVQDIQ